jgi:hypothetical protein
MHNGNVRRLMVVVWYHYSSLVSGPITNAAHRRSFDASTEWMQDCIALDQRPQFRWPFTFAATPRFDQLGLLYRVVRTLVDHGADCRLYLLTARVAFMCLQRGLLRFVLLQLGPACLSVCLASQALAIPWRLMVRTYSTEIYPLPGRTVLICVCMWSRVIPRKTDARRQMIHL